MARIAHQGLPDDPVTGDVINANSPLRFDDRMLGGLINICPCRSGYLYYSIYFGWCHEHHYDGCGVGSTEAEVLVGLALAQLVRPGAPVLYGGVCLPPIRT